MNVKLKAGENLRVLNSDDVYFIMQRVLLRENKIRRNREHFWTIGLDNANKILYIELVSIGGTNKTIAEPIQVFRVGVLKGAVKMILVHNHPAGNLEPGTHDKDITDRLIQAGIILDIKVIDHLIITEKTYRSFADTGLMEELEKSTKYVPDFMMKERLKKQIETAVGKAKQEWGKEMALELKKRGVEVEIIETVTGLSRKVIKRLK
jgi:DNA repair protein RadC